MKDLHLRDIGFEGCCGLDVSWWRKLADYHDSVFEGSVIQALAELSSTPDFLT